jgi:hypothetical protein
VDIIDPPSTIFLIAVELSSAQWVLWIRQIVVEGRGGMHGSEKDFVLEAV